MVCEYEDVFSEEFPGMPPNRPVELVIELEPGTEPACRCPYKLSPDELKELKKQLDEQVHDGGPVCGPRRAPTMAWYGPADRPAAQDPHEGAKPREENNVETPSGAASTRCSGGAENPRPSLPQEDSVAAGS